MKADYITARQQRRMTIATRQAAREVNLSVPDLIAHDRRPHVVKARDAAIVACRGLGYSLPIIATFFNRDHTTIMAAQRRAERK